MGDESRDEGPRPLVLGRSWRPERRGRREASAGSVGAGRDRNPLRVALGPPGSGRGGRAGAQGRRGALGGGSRADPEGPRGAVPPRPGPRPGRPSKTLDACAAGPRAAGLCDRSLGIRGAGKEQKAGQVRRYRFTPVPLGVT